MTTPPIGQPTQVPWAPTPNTLTYHRGTTLPHGPTTSVTLVVTDPAGRVLGVDVRRRGWDLPGGHIEDGETLLDAAVRELHEETGVRLSPERFTIAGWGHLHVDGPRPAGYPYPFPDTYQPILTAHTRGAGSSASGDSTEHPENPGHPGHPGHPEPPQDGDSLVPTVPEEIAAASYLRRMELVARCGDRPWLPIVLDLLDQPD